MYSQFRRDVKAMLRSKRMTYSDLSEKADVSESSIKSFMCGASDSRRMAEKIADALDFDLIYSNNVYSVMKKEDTKCQN